MSSAVLFQSFKVSDSLPLSDVAFGSNIGEGLNIQKQEIQDPPVSNGVANLISNLSFDLSQVGNATIQPVSALPTLPDANYPQGTVVFLTTDNKLYRSTGPTWTSFVDGADIAVNSIVTNMIVAGAITAAKIASHTITANEIAAGTITATQIAAATITATQIASNTITAALIAANTITAGQIAASTITATELAAGSVTAVKISVSQLSAISADLGSITAGTITGVLFQTAASAGRVSIDATNGVQAFTSGGSLRTHIGTVNGYVETTAVGGLSGILSGSLTLGDAAFSNQVTIGAGGLNFIEFIIGGSSAGLISSSGFVGNGTSLTLSPSVVKYGGSSVAGNIAVNSGYGIAAGGTAFACSSNAEIYQSSALVASISTAGTQINIGGTLYTLSVVAGIVNAT